MRFTPTFLDEIRERVPISSLIGQRVTFDRKKTNQSRGDFWACCPFHGEKSPSFHCEDPKGRYHCFGCGVSGDHFRFLTEMDGISFPEAVERIADMAGMDLPQQTPQDIEREARRATLAEAMVMAVEFYEQQLQTPAGAKARAYLRDRGVSARIQKEFRLGYAPESRNGIKSYLAEKGVPKDVIDNSGLVVAGEDIAVSYDRFRDRLMFPIEDGRERPIAYGGRALSDDVPAKYLNSSESDLFSKGRVLYNLARARKASRDAGTLIAVEGYMDVIALADAGVAHAVAPLGTALTEDQLALMWRIVDVPVLCFDGDQAGQRAAYRAAETALAGLTPGKSLRFAVLPEGKDPDDVVKAGGREAFEAVIAKSRPLSEVLWTRETMAKSYDTPEGRADLEGRLKKLTALIGDETVRRHYAQDMRERLQNAFGGGNRNSSGQNYNRGNKGGNARGGANSGRVAISSGLARSALVSRGLGSVPLGEAAIVVAAINYPILAEADMERFEALPLSDDSLVRLRMVLLDAVAEQGELSREDALVILRERSMIELFETQQARLRAANLWTALPDAAIEDVRVAFNQAVSHHLRRSTLQAELRDAERDAGDNGNEESMLRVFAIRDELNRMRGSDALIEGFGSMSGRGKRT